VVDGLKATNTGNAIFVKLGNRAQNDQGYIRNITLRNMDVELAFGRPDTDYDIRGPEVSYFHNPFPSSITGWPGHPVENVVLENINISAPGRADKGMAYVKAPEVPENYDRYPEFTMFGELPAWAFFLRHVEGITLRNVNLTLRDRDFRPAICQVNVNGYKDEGVNITLPEPKHCGKCHRHD
ncbi:MAG: glycoside hydrolase family 28 protein, partial [Prevotella sp.]|nr:glycoside hydrolase family 28 protein [Prevotella sp.]